MSSNSTHKQSVPWSTALLGELCNSAIDGPFGSRLKSEHYAPAGVRVVRLQNIGVGEFVDKDEAFISNEYFESLKSFEVCEGDLLVASLGDDSYPAGRSAIAPASIEPAIIKADCFRIRIDRSRASPRYLCAYLNSSLARAAIIRRSHGQTRLRLNLANVKQIEVPMPPLRVQEFIADAVDDMDDVLKCTRAAIDQTRKLKEALLQDLLTNGLPGRYTEFIEVRLGDVFQPRKESGIDALPRVAVTMHNGLVNRDEIERRMETNLRDDQHLLVRCGDIAYNMMRMWQGVFGLAEFDCLVSPAYVVVEPTGGLRSDYAAHLFKLPATIRKFHLFSQGLTEDRLRLYFEQFAPIKVSIPRSVDDQARIVELLATLDHRIASQSDELSQLTEAKSALSQALLTGQVRVPTAEVASA